MHTPLRDIYFPRPSCRCSDCIQNPTSSHGIHSIGVYKIPSRLSLRGGKVTDPRVEYMTGDRGGFCIGRSVSVFPNAQAPDPRTWDI